ncbi:MAG: hypothetical protein Q4F96_05010, partial [Bacillota bacterium]|nr:hypothetical protein [Bacillota bacterium]
ISVSAIHFCIIDSLLCQSEFIPHISTGFGIACFLTSVSDTFLYQLPRTPARSRWVIRGSFSLPLPNQSRHLSSGCVDFARVFSHCLMAMRFFFLPASSRSSFGTPGAYIYAWNGIEPSGSPLRSNMFTFFKI